MEIKVEEQELVSFLEELDELIHKSSVTQSFLRTIAGLKESVDNVEYKYNDEYVDEDYLYDLLENAVSGDVRENAEDMINDRYGSIYINGHDYDAYDILQHIDEYALDDLITDLVEAAIDDCKSDLNIPGTVVEVGDNTFEIIKKW